MTLAINLFTIGFWLWLSRLLLSVPPPAPLAEGAGLIAWLTCWGGPMQLGMGIFSLAGAATGYLSVKLAWRLRIAHCALRSNAGASRLSNAARY